MFFGGFYNLSIWQKNACVPGSIYIEILIDYVCSKFRVISWSRIVSSQKWQFQVPSARVAQPSSSCRTVYQQVKVNSQLWFLNTCENFIWESKSGKQKVRVWVKIWNPYSQVSIVKQVPSFAKHCTKVSALSVLSAHCCICIISRLLYLSSEWFVTGIEVERRTRSSETYLHALK